MKFGLFYQLPCATTQDAATRYQETIEQIVYAEELGFDTAWLAELHFNARFSIMPAPLLIAAALAQRTSRLRLGAAVLLLPLQHPVRIAEETAVVDLLSQGRLEVGVGRGMIAIHFQGFNVPREESRERFEEALMIITHAWTQEVFQFHGKYFHAPETALVRRDVEASFLNYFQAISHQARLGDRDNSPAYAYLREIRKRVEAVRWEHLETIKFLQRTPGVSPGVNAAQLARGLGIDGKTVARYLDLLVDLLLVRRLPPWHQNVGKRLVKSPKVFLCDSGIAHALLGLSGKEALLGHPIVGPSWEGFVLENHPAYPRSRSEFLSHVRRCGSRPRADLPKWSELGDRDQAQRGAEGGARVPQRVCGPPSRAAVCGVCWRRAFPTGRRNRGSGIARPLRNTPGGNGPRGVTLPNVWLTGRAKGVLLPCVRAGLGVVVRELETARELP